MQFIRWIHVDPTHAWTEKAGPGVRCITPRSLVCPSGGIRLEIPLISALASLSSGDKRSGNAQSPGTLHGVAKDL